MQDTTSLRARRTTYKGVEMRSRLEARYAAWLDSKGIQWRYEPQCFGSDEGQYLPDFRLFGVTWMGLERPLFVEVKPNTSFYDNGRDGHAPLHWHRIITASIPDAILALEVATWHSTRVAFTLRDRSRSIDCSWVTRTDGVGLAALVQRSWQEHQ